MIRKIAMLGIIGLWAIVKLFSQEQDKSFNIWEYKPLFMESLYYKNLIFSDSDIKYKPMARISLVDISIYSSPNVFYQLDIAMLRFKYFKIGAFTFFPSDGPVDLNFLFPLGFELPLATFKRFSFSYGADLYLLPITINDDSNKDYFRPRFIDTRIRLENNNWIRFSALAGYRIPLTSAWGVIETSKRLVYRNDISGFYVGLSFALGKTRVENDGLGAMESARAKGSGYGEFISKYPKTPYSSKKILTRVIFEDTNPENRKEAVKIITDDQVLFTKIAQEDPDSTVRLAALVRIWDQSILNNIALHDKSYSLRSEAVSRLSDQKMLIKIALEDEDYRVRRTAIGLLTDETILLRVALTDKAHMVRSIAADRITDQGYLSQIILEGPDTELRLRMTDKITDQGELLKISLKTTDWNVRRSAFNRLNNSYLEQFATSMKDPGAVIAARIRLGTTTWKEEFASGKLGDLVGATALVVSPAPVPADILRICHSFIALGDESRIPELVSLLFRFGDVTLAEDYMNCGQPDLLNSGMKWCTDHGYNVSRGNGSSRVRWGEKK